jgi:deoxycytidine triphosphate deaminase/plasmid maintenance system antidote protein VapI
MNIDEEKYSPFGKYVRDYLMGKEGGKRFTSIIHMANELAISRQHLYLLLKGKQNISPLIAAKLAHLTGKSQSFYLRLGRGDLNDDFHPYINLLEAEDILSEWRTHGSRPLVDKEIKLAQKMGFINISSFDEDFIEPVSIDLRIGESVTLILDEKTEQEIHLDDAHPSILLKPGKIAIVKTLERVKLSDFLLGNLGSGTFLSAHSISLVHGMHCDPGWDNYLWVTLKNIGFEDYNLVYGHSLITMSIVFLPITPENPIQGENTYQKNMRKNNPIIDSAKTMGLDQLKSTIEELRKMEAEKQNL